MNAVLRSEEQRRSEQRTYNRRRTDGDWIYAEGIFPRFVDRRVADRRVAERRNNPPWRSSLMMEQSSAASLKPGKEPGNRTGWMGRWTGFVRGKNK